jgi:predicted MFS family arabinose efflux permease
MRKLSWKKMLQSWWGRCLAGAFLGGLLVAFSGVNEPGFFLVGMVLGALVLFLLGRLE